MLYILQSDNLVIWFDIYPLWFNYDNGVEHVKGFIVILNLKEERCLQ